MTPLINVVPADATVTIAATSELVHLCPFFDEVDRGRVTITWRCEGNTYELHSLRAYLASWATSAVSHEDITDRIRGDLLVDGVTVLGVETRWNTAHMEVSCSSSPTPAAVAP